MSPTARRAHPDHSRQAAPPDGRIRARGAARRAFETRDDEAALALYRDAVRTADPSALARRALIRSGQTMVTYYATGDIAAARRIVDDAVPSSCWAAVPPAKRWGPLPIVTFFV